MIASWLGIVLWVLASITMAFAHYPHERMVQRARTKSDVAQSSNLTAVSKTPTKTLAARTVPLSTMPPVSIFVPSLPGDAQATEPTSIYYYGQGFISYTSVFALVNGEPGKGDGPRTEMMYQGPTEIKVAKVMRTEYVDKESRSGLYDVQCKKSNGDNWNCRYMLESGTATTTYYEVSTQTNPNTLITPVIGKLDQLRRSTAKGFSDIPSMSNGKVQHHSPSNGVAPTLFHRAAATAVLGMAVVVILGAVLI